jgi:hypothetical protein
MADLNDPRDLEFLKKPELWPGKLFGTRMTRVKTSWQDRPQRFGSIYANDTTCVYVDQIEGRILSPARKEKFPSLEELVKVWMVD